MEEPKIHGKCCKICCEANNETSRCCPVCKEGNYMKLIPNYIVKQLIEDGYPEIAKLRAEQLAQLQELKKKLVQFLFSERYIAIDKKFEEIMSENIIMNSKSLVESLGKLVEFKPLISEPEAYYYIHCKLTNQSYCFLVGEYLIKKQDIESLLTSADSAKGKKHTEIKKWLPVILMSNLRPGTSFEQYQKVAKITKIDIGKNTDLQEFKSRPVFWIKDLDLGNINQPTCSHYACAHANSRYDTSSDEDDEDSSSSDDYPFYNHGMGGM